MLIRWEVDLCEFLKAYPSEPRLKNLRGAARQAVFVESAIADLRAAEHRLHIAGLLGGLQPYIAGAGLTGHDMSSTLGSLFAHAVILYARATHGKSKGRPFIIPTDRFAAEQLECHNRIIPLRNEGLAHYGKTEEFLHGPWSQETIKVDLHPEGMTPSFCGVVMHHRPHLVDDLRIAIAAAMARGVELEDQAFVKLSAALQEWKSSDPSYKEKIAKFPLDGDFYRVRNGEEARSWSHEPTD